jgi:hypothetical protein
VTGDEPLTESDDVPPTPTTDEEFAALPILDLDKFAKREVDPLTESPRLTRDQAAIVGLFTGIACGPFEDIHRLAEHLTGGPVWTHEFPSRFDEFKDLARPLFLAICAERETTNA